MPTSPGDTLRALAATLLEFSAVVRMPLGCTLQTSSNLSLYDVISKVEVPGPKTPVTIDWQQSDYELFRKCLADIADDTWEDDASLNWDVEKHVAL